MAVQAERKSGLPQFPNIVVYDNGNSGSLKGLLKSLRRNPTQEIFPSRDFEYEFFVSPEIVTEFMQATNGTSETLARRLLETGFVSAGLFGITRPNETAIFAKLTMSNLEPLEDGPVNRRVKVERKPSSSSVSFFRGEEEDPSINAKLAMDKKPYVQEPLSPLQQAVSLVKKEPIPQSYTKDSESLSGNFVEIKKPMMIKVARAVGDLQGVHLNPLALGETRFAEQLKDKLGKVTLAHGILVFSLGINELFNSGLIPENLNFLSISFKKPVFSGDFMKPEIRLLENGQYELKIINQNNEIVVMGAIGFGNNSPVV